MFSPCSCQIHELKMYLHTGLNCEFPPYMVKAKCRFLFLMERFLLLQMLKLILRKSIEVLFCLFFYVNLYIYICNWHLVLLYICNYEVANLGYSANLDWIGIVRESQFGLSWRPFSKRITVQLKETDLLPPSGCGASARTELVYIQVIHCVLIGFRCSLVRE